MKWISIQLIGQKIRQVIVRFPFAMIIALVGTVAISITLTEFVDYQTTDVWINAFLIAVVAFPWVTLAALLAEKYRLRRVLQWFLQAVVTAGFFAVYQFLPDGRLDGHETLLTQLLVTAGIGVVLMFVLPFDARDPLRLWRLLGRVTRAALIALLFGVGIGIGLTASLLAIVYLFQIGEIDSDNWTAIIWLLTMGIFAIWTFLVLLPTPQDEPALPELPLVLRRFVLFVWLPLVAVFFVILYVYLARIIMLWDWPSGGVVWWILGFSAAGISAYLNLFTTNGSYERLKRIYFNRFFAALVPMIAVYGLAIWFRIEQYGVTQQRYMVVIGGVWLLLIVCCYGLARVRILSVGVYAAVLLAAITIVGPWNMFSVSLHSQTQRLEELLERNAILVNGRIVDESEHVITRQDQEQIRSTLSYVLEHEGVERIQPWFEQDLGTSPRGYEVMKYLAISDSYVGAGVDDSFSVVRDYNPQRDSITATEVRGYDFVLSGIHLRSNDDKIIVIGDERLALLLAEDGKLQVSSVDASKNTTPLIMIDLAPKILGLLDKYGSEGTNAPASEMTVEAENTAVKLRLNFTDINGKSLGGGLKLSSVQLQLVGSIK